MAKDPAFLFYSSDFMTGAALMTFDQRGKYITLLCLQHQTGHLVEQDVLMICGSHDKRIFDKFIKDEQGNYYNERLEFEIFKRKAYSASRSNNRKGNPDKPLKKKKSKKTYVEHMENEIENKDEVIIKEVLPKKNEEPIIYPFTSDEFLKSWENWKSYKLDNYKFQFKSNRTEQAALVHLSKISHGIEAEAIEIIIIAMSRQWEGLFGITKKYNNGQQTNSGKQDDRNDLAAVNAMFNQGSEPPTRR